MAALSLEAREQKGDDKIDRARILAMIRMLAYLRREETEIG